MIAKYNAPPRCISKLKRGDIIIFTGYDNNKYTFSKFVNGEAMVDRGGYDIIISKTVRLFKIIKNVSK